MTDTGRDRKLLDEERSRLLELKESLTEATADIEREPTGDPSAGGHIADAGSEMFERSRDLSIVHDLDAQLADVEHAKARLENGSYGTRGLREADRLGAARRSPGDPVLHRGPAGSGTRGPGRVSGRSVDRGTGDGHLSRRNEITIVRVTPQGPLLVRGPLRLLDEQGHEVSTRRRVNALCRCGRSTTQPFCDGTHKIVPFSPRAVNGASVSEHGSDSPPG